MLNICGSPALTKVDLPLLIQCKVEIRQSENLLALLLLLLLLLLARVKTLCRH